MIGWPVASVVSCVLGWRRPVLRAFGPDTAPHGLVVGGFVVLSQTYPSSGLLFPKRSRWSKYDHLAHELVGR